MMIYFHITIFQSLFLFASLYAGLHIKCIDGYASYLKNIFLIQRKLETLSELFMYYQVSMMQ